MSDSVFDYVRDVADSVYDFITDKMDGMNEDIMRLEDYKGDRNRFILDFINNFGDEGDITGLVNHAYYNTTAEAVESLKGNHLLLHAALMARFYPDMTKAFNQIKDPDLCDAYIRAYVLPEAIGIALDDIEKERGQHFKSKNDKEPAR